MNTSSNSHSEFKLNILHDTLHNQNYRKVLYTTKQTQLVLMNLKPNEDIGEETHKHTSQFIRVEGGSGSAVVNGNRYYLKSGSAIVIPAGALHNIIASKEGMSLYTLYSPPEHPDGLVEKNKH